MNFDGSPEYRVKAKKRLLAFVQIDSKGCWIWQGATMWSKNLQYAVFTWRNQWCLAHRASYNLFVGPLPEDLTIDHLCRHTLCVNPEHLELVTQQENILRGDGPTAINSRKIQCIHGHPFDSENTAYRPNGGRYCKQCNRESTKRYLHRKVVV